MLFFENHCYKRVLDMTIIDLYVLKNGTCYQFRRVSTFLWLWIEYEFLLVLAGPCRVLQNP